MAEKYHCHGGWLLSQDAHDRRHLRPQEHRRAAFVAGRDARVRGLDLTEVDADADAPDGRTVRLAALCVLEAAAGLALR